MARVNQSPNPYAALSSAGWFGGSRFTGVSGTIRSVGYLFSAYSGGGPPRGPAYGGQAVTLSAYIWAQTNGTVPVRIDWYRNGSFYSSTSNINFQMQYGVWRRVNITAIAPSVADQALMYFPGATVQVLCTAVLHEYGSSLGSYFDGDTTPGGSWDGAYRASTSTLVENQSQIVAPTGYIAVSGRPALAGGRGPAIRERLSSIGAAGAAHGVITSADTQYDDLLVAIRTSDGDDTSLATPYGTAGTWARATYGTAGANLADLSIWTRRVTAEGAQTVTITGSKPRGGTAISALHVYVIGRSRGVDIAAFVARVTSGNTFTLPVMPIFSPSEHLIYAVSARGPSSAGVLSAPAGSTKRTDRVLGDHSSATFDRVAPNTGSTPAGTAGYSATATTGVAGGILLRPSVQLANTTPGAVTVFGPPAAASMVRKAVRAEPASGVLVIEGPDPFMYAVIYALPGIVIVGGLTPRIPIKVKPEAGRVAVGGYAMKSVEHNTKRMPDVFYDEYHDRYLTVRNGELRPIDKEDLHERYHVVPLRSR